MLPEIIFFDLDDTLVDHTHAARCAVERILGEHPALSGLTPERIGELWSMDFRKYWKMVIENRLTLKESRLIRFRLLFSRLGVSIQDGELERIVSVYADEYISSVIPIPGAIDVVKRARSLGVSTGIITNTTIDMTEQKSARCGLEGLFDHVMVSQEIGIMKPDPEIFSEALRRSGMRADGAIMIGDSMRDDIQGARNAGIRHLWFNRHGKPRDETEVAEIGSFDPPDRAWEKIVSEYSRSP